MIENNLVKLTKPLIKTAAITCAEAFANDPFMAHTIPDPLKRPNLRFAFEFLLSISMIPGTEAYITSSNCEGIAVWQDAQKKRPFGLFLRGVNPFLSFRCGLRFISGEIRAGVLCADIRKKYAPERHIYLTLLAVHPKYHGQGLSSQLLRPMLERLDETRTACYLETQNQKNVSLYQHFGFKVVHEILFDKMVPFYFF
jgi:GNAT superfamily N-acetyltransferase